MFDNSINYIVFISQVILLSVYIPKKISERMSYIVANFPSDLYPKLYVKSDDHYEKQQRRYRLANQIILSIAIALLLMPLFWELEFNQKLVEVFPIGFGMVQFLPLMFLELSECNQYRLMRYFNRNASRSAQLTRRRLFDFISPGLFWASIGIYILTVLLDVAMHDYIIEWGHDSMQRFGILTVGNLFFATIIWKQIYGKKKNPLQDIQDRIHEIKIAVKSLVTVMITVNIYFVVMASGDVFNLEVYEPAISSLYFQLIAIASIGYRILSMKLEDMNFDVYKKPATEA